MISFKKSYAEQLLQLALALSLLRVDPESYLGRGWDSQLELQRNGDGWQLEMLRAVPISEYPYANRKAMIPLIEDLIRFDHRQDNLMNNLHNNNITAYLLNVQSSNQTTTASSSGSTTGGHQDLSDISSNSGNSGVGGSLGNSGSAGGGGHTIGDSFAGSTTATSNAIDSITATASAIANNSNFGSVDIDLLLSSESLQDQLSLLDQSLADLRDDISPFSVNSLYYGLPLKDEPFLLSSVNSISESVNEINIKEESIASTSQQQSASSSSSLFSSSASSSSSVIGRRTRVPDSTNPPSSSSETTGDFMVSWDQVMNITKTEVKEEENIENVDVKSFIKLEKEEVKSENDEEKDDQEFKPNNIELTEEESEIVEVLWKQDVDLGYSLSPPKLSTQSGTSDATASASKTFEDEVEKLKALEELNEDKPKEDQSEKSVEENLDDEWAGIPFRIDNETGEYIRLPLHLDELLQDVLQLADLSTDEIEEETKEDNSEKDKTSNLEANEGKNSKSEKLDSLDDISSSATVDPPQSEVEISSLPSPLFDFDDAKELEEFDMMIQSATAGPFQHRGGQNYAPNSAFRQSGFHHHHHHHQPRVPLSRGVSMEQRLQDIASLFNPIPGMGVGMGVSDMSPYSHYPTHYPYQSTPGIPQHGQFPPHHHPSHSVLHNATLADLGATQPHYGHNLGSAVTSSMHLTNSTHDADAGAAGYKMEHDMMYYSNTSSELNHTTDGFINSILNDEDLQLMDMGVNESFCTMRMLEGNTTSNNSSVLGSSSGSAGSHTGHLLSMPTSLGPLGGSDGLGGSGTAGDRLDASSDSAVSSMGSERVPSLSDGEWGDAGSDSAQDYHQGKYGGPYDYSYTNNSRLGGGGGGNGGADGPRPPQPPVAQKKHQMFGKRYFQDPPAAAPPATNMPPGGLQQQPQHTPSGPSDHIPPPVKYEYEQHYGMHQNGASAGGNGNTISSGAAVIASSGHLNMEGAVGPIMNNKNHHVPLMTNAEMKYACSLDFTARPPRTHDLISHNHTYTLPQGSGSAPRPQIRDKKQKKGEDEHLTRDEKRARSLNIPIAVTDIINLPMDEFNERLSKYDLTENQLSLIRDIRRRGKNKVAAQNCRKRKLDQILSLEDEVREVRRRKDRYYQEREIVLAERKRIANKFATLHRHIFQYLRDADGNPCSPSEYSLQQAADGSVYLLRRENNKSDGNGNSTATTSHPSGSHHQSNHHTPQGPSPSSHHQKE